MTYTFEKTFGKFDSSTNFEGNKLIVEYVFSSVSDCIKIVEMTRIGANEYGEIGENFHRFNWMSESAQKELMEDLENDMTNRMCGTMEEDMVGFEGNLNNLEQLRI
jgi:hypothetical protein